MKKLLFFLKRINLSLLLPAVFLTSLGLLSLYSSSPLSFFKRQVFFLFAGIFLMITISFLKLNFLENNPYFILGLYFFAILLLVGVLFFGINIRGRQGWYKIGNFHFDPLAFVILIIILVLAKYFSKRQREIYQLRHIFFSAFYPFFAGIFVLFQPDLGSLVLLAVVWLGVIIFSGIKVSHFLAILAFFLILAGISWNYFLADYQKERILTFLNPSRDPQGAGWNLVQAKIAIGSGGFFGKGFKKGFQVQAGFLPEARTDFIFSAIAEEFGFFAIFVLIFLFGFLIYQILKIIYRLKRNFQKLFVAGFLVFLVFELFWNIAMNLGIVPIIGLSLPFVSYGGSYLLAFYLGLGLVSSFKNSQL